MRFYSPDGATCTVDKSDVNSSYVQNKPLLLCHKSYKSHQSLSHGIVMTWPIKLSGVIFVPPWLYRCESAAAAGVCVLQLNCVEYSNLCTEQKITHLPTLLLYKSAVMVCKCASFQLYHEINSSLGIGTIWPAGNFDLSAATTTTSVEYNFKCFIWV